VVIAARSLAELTAGEIMSPKVVTIAATLPLGEAARRLAADGVRGAPVVDESGRCVGVLSVTDIARWASGQVGTHRTCRYWEHGRGADGEDLAVCKLAAGACALQGRQVGPGGEPLTTCRQPHGVCVGEWQVLEPEERLAGTVRDYMTPDPVTAFVEAPMRTLARMMIDASVHRVIVVDDAGRPIGIVSSTDMLAAFVRCSADVPA
jgi:CBS domain-containing protein